MNPQYSPDEIARLYTNRDATDLISVYARISASEPVRQRYVKKLEHLERSLPGRGRLLDFACGSGAFFELAQSRGWDAHGTELGEWAAQAATARNLKNLHIGTLAELQFPANSFDVVHAAQVFEHLPQPKNELREIRRLLRPQGLLYIDVPNYRTLSIVLGRDDFMLNEPPQHVSYFTPRTLQQLLSTAGFDVTSVGTEGGLKWENLLGRTIKSDIAQAYEMVPGIRPERGVTELAGSRTRKNRQSRIAVALKRSIVRGVIKPLLYDRLKVGMLLFAVARRP
jgi:SAM-dependent methyltransferase